MRILLLTQWYPPEPQEFLAEMAESLQQLGHEVTVLTGFPNWPTGEVYPGYHVKPWQREILNGVPLVRVALYPNHSRSGWRRILNYVSFALSATLLGPWLLTRKDVIHVIPPVTAAIPAWVLSRLWRVPFTHEIQDIWPETLAATGMLSDQRMLAAIGRFAEWVYRCAAAIRVITPGFRANLIQKGVLPAKLQVISNWVDTNFYQPVEPDPVLSTTLGLAGRFNIMYAGAIGPAQDLDTVLAAAKLLDDLPQVQFVMLGDGIDRLRLQETALMNDIRNVTFLGRHPADAMPSFYALADVLLVHLRDDPLFRITVPHKIFTYMASGKPVLAAVEGDAAVVIETARAGLVCAPSNPQSLAETVRCFYEMSTDERSALGQNGRYAARETYGREHLVAQIAAMLNKTVSDTRARVDKVV